MADLMNHFLYHSSNSIPNKLLVANATSKNTAKSVEARLKGNKLYAQKFHDIETHSEILSYYTQSVAWAKNGSEELAMAYGNRSALLKHLCKYEECLVDIEKACQITKSGSLKVKLAARKTECLMALEKKSRSFQDEARATVTINFKASKKIPCASESIAIKFDDKYGRHIVATQDIEPGTIIAVEKAFASVPVEFCMYLNCTHCMSIAWNTIPCDSCAYVVFCSEKCKEEALMHYHNVECLVLCFINNLISFSHAGISHVLLSIRVFIVSIRKNGLSRMIKDVADLESNKGSNVDGFFDDNKVFQSDKFKSICNLCGNTNHSEFIKTLLNGVVDFLHANTNIFIENSCDNSTINENISLAKEILIRLYFIMRKNSYSFDYSWCDYSSSWQTEKIDKMSSIGVMIAPFCCLFNHSCCNNVGRVFTRNQEIILFTTLMIKNKQQLYVNYGPDIFTEKSNRINMLKKFYDFNCECQVCEENWQMNSSLNESPDDKLTKTLSNKFREAGIPISIINYLSGHEEKIDFSEKTAKDFIKILMILDKHCTGFEGFLHSMMLQDYLDFYFGNLYGIKNNVPDAC